MKIKIWSLKFCIRGLEKNIVKLLTERSSLSDVEMERYRRQLMLHGFTEEHQQRWRAIFSISSLKSPPALIAFIPKAIPEWEELGFPVLGAVSGVLGCLMSIEAIKVLTGYGKPLLFQMLLFSAMSMDFRKLNTRRDCNCRVCGSRNQAP